MRSWQAVQWLRRELELAVTERYLKSETERGELRATLMANCRMYSSADLWHWACTRPTAKPGRKPNASNTVGGVR